MRGIEAESCEAERTQSVEPQDSVRLPSPREAWEAVNLPSPAERRSRRTGAKRREDGEEEGGGETSPPRGAEAKPKRTH